MLKVFLVSVISKVCIFYFTYRYFGKVTFGKNVKINWRFSFSGHGTVVVEDSVQLWAHEEWNRFQTYSKNAVIKLGKNSKINGALFQARKSIMVSENCIIGSAILLDNDFHYIDPKSRFIEYGALKEKEEDLGSEIFIEKNVWIAGQAVILKGVRVGENSIVAIRSVVSKDIEKNIIVAGNPAKEVKKI